METSNAELTTYTYLLLYRDGLLSAKTDAHDTGLTNKDFVLAIFDGKVSYHSHESAKALAKKHNVQLAKDLEKLLATDNIPSDANYVIMCAPNGNLSSFSVRLETLFELLDKKIAESNEAIRKRPQKTKEELSVYMSDIVARYKSEIRQVIKDIANLGLSRNDVTICWVGNDKDHVIKALLNSGLTVLSNVLKALGSSNVILENFIRINVPESTYRLVILCPEDNVLITSLVGEDSFDEEVTPPVHLMDLSTALKGIDISDVVRPVTTDKTLN
jgi:hypothetical protein